MVNKQQKLVLIYRCIQSTHTLKNYYKFLYFHFLVFIIKSCLFMQYFQFIQFMKSTLDIIQFIKTTLDIIQFIKPTLDFSSAFKSKLQNLKTHRTFWKPNTHKCRHSMFQNACIILFLVIVGGYLLDTCWVSRIQK